MERERKKKRKRERERLGWVHRAIFQGLTRGQRIHIVKVEPKLGFV